MRLIQLSDMHFGGEDAAAVAGVTDWLSGQAYDLLVVSGDSTLVGAPEQFAAAKTWLDSLKGPKLFTPGNHDAPYHNVAYRLFAPWTRYRRAFGAVDAESAEPLGFDAPIVRKPYDVSQVVAALARAAKSRVAA